MTNAAVTQYIYMLALLLFMQAHAWFPVKSTQTAVDALASQQNCAPQHAAQCLATDRGCTSVHGLRVRPTSACVATLQQPSTAPPTPFAPLGSCWIFFESGCPNGRMAFGSAPSTEWRRDNWAEAQAQYQGAAGCGKRRDDLNRWCGASDVRTHHVPNDIHRFAPSVAAATNTAAAPATTSAAIVLVLGHNRSDVRPQYRGNPDAQYRDSAHLVLRCVLSLRRVNTTLPIRLLVSGERELQREAVFASHGVQVVRAPPLTVPAWASPYMRGTFHKFAALALTDVSTVILLDSDTIAMRNIDHLMHAPAPAAYFHFDAGRTCPAPGEGAHQQGQPSKAPPPPLPQSPPANTSTCSLGVLNSGVMILAPSPRLHHKARRLMAMSADDAAGTALGGEGLFETSDQRLWFELYDGR